LSLFSVGRSGVTPQFSLYGDRLGAITVFDSTNVYVLRLRGFVKAVAVLAAVHYAFALACFAALGGGLLC
jgi:hypothetical protein